MLSGMDPLQKHPIVHRTQARRHHARCLRDEGLVEDQPRLGPRAPGHRAGPDQDDGPLPRRPPGAPWRGCRHHRQRLPVRPRAIGAGQQADAVLPARTLLAPADHQSPVPGPVPGRVHVGPRPARVRALPAPAPVWPSRPAGRRGCPDDGAARDGRADIAVHSLKDVPMELPDGFALACVLEREDARDAFVSARYAALAELPAGAVVGTSSLRRVVLLRALRPDLRIEPLRGNLDTRLRKLDEGRFDAIVLAAAGLKRLGLGAHIRARFEPEQMLPAAGQGALAIEVRAERRDLLQALSPLAHRPTWLAVTAERAVSRAMGGSCSMPLAAYARFDGAALRLDAAWGEPDGGAALVRAGASAPVTDAAAAEALGTEVAAQLQRGGAHAPGI